MQQRSYLIQGPIRVIIPGLDAVGERDRKKTTKGRRMDAKAPFSPHPSSPPDGEVRVIGACLGLGGQYARHNLRHPNNIRVYLHWGFCSVGCST